MKQRLGSTILIVLLSLIPTAAEAKLHKLGFLGDIGLGAMIPIADDDWNRISDATFNFSMRAGVDLWLTERLGVAPELQIDLIPVNVQIGSLQAGQLSLEPQFGRYRFLGGARFEFDFGIGAAYVRFVMGLDYINGTEQLTIGGFRSSTTITSHAFTAEPGFGVQFKVWRMLVAGAYAGFPVALHNLDRAVDNAGTQKFTSVDITLLATVGVRIY